MLPKSPGERSRTLEFEKLCCATMAGRIGLPQEFVRNVSFPAPPYIMTNEELLARGDKSSAL